MAEVIVRPGEPDEYTIPFTHGWEEREIVEHMDRLKIDVDRQEAKAANLSPKNDRIELVGVDTVLLTDVKTGGSTWTLVCYSAEWLANRAGYTQGGDLREGTDKELITGLVSEVSGWSEGNISEFTGPLSFVFSHAQRHEAIRRIEPNVPGEIQFRDYGTVDYVDRLGSDKSGSVELSAGAGTIENEINITERNRELSGTHIRVLGAHEGEAQLATNLIPEDDTNAQSQYENVVTYQTPRWTSEEDTDWDRWSNNDITDQDTLDEEAAALGEELTDVHVTAETTVPASVGLEVGDTVRVVKDDADLDRDMRVHKKWRKAGSRNDTGSGAAVVDKVEVSTRTTLQTESDADLEELRKFNTGFQGSSVAVNAGPFGKAVDSGNPLEFNFKYPQLEYENTAELHVKGLNYRIDSVGAASGGGAFISSTDNSDFENVTASSSDFTGIDVGGSWTTVDSITPASDTSELRMYGEFWIPSNGSGDEVDFRLYNQGTGQYIPDSSGYQHTLSPVKDRTVIFPEATNTNGDTVEVQLRNPDVDPYNVNAKVTWFGIGQHTHDVDVPSHTHDPLTGVFTTSDTPSGVDVDVNGTTVATNIGTGSFETVVDVSGEFLNDSWNTVTLSSDSLGILEVSAFVEGYDQIGQV
jgi:hypothetical protein